MGTLFGTDGVRGLANADLTPELALALGRAGHIRGDPEVHLLHESLLPEEIVIVEGYPCTVGERAVFDAMRTAGSVVEAVVVDAGADVLVMVELLGNALLPTAGGPSVLPSRACAACLIFNAVSPESPAMLKRSE